MANLVIEKPHGKTAGITSLPDDLPVMLDANTCALIAGTSSKCVRDHCASGDIKAVKVGRVWRINRDAFLMQMGLM